MSYDQMSTQMTKQAGFIAALDQSGGSTPKALRGYGIDEDAYKSDEEMFALIHAMRARIIKSPAFTSDKVIGAILFERTMDGVIDGTPTANYLWNSGGVVPFLKVDKGLLDGADGVRLMKPMPDLDATLERAKTKGIFGTKMRSVVDAANAAGIAANVAQQFEVGQQILDHGLMPILEPEVTITITDKAAAEVMLRDAIFGQLDKMGQQTVMLKLSLPSVPNFYQSLTTHPNVMRVVALSGGYTRDDANTLLGQNSGMIASFSRALAEGLSANQSDAEFDATLAMTVNSVFNASCAG
jgi:fructose-bisphosphate aldolase class I